MKFIFWVWRKGSGDQILIVENTPASATPEACCGVSERTSINGITSVHFEDSLSAAGGLQGASILSYLTMKGLWVPHAKVRAG